MLFVYAVFISNKNHWKIKDCVAENHLGCFKGFFRNPSRDFRGRLLQEFLQNFWEISPGNPLEITLHVFKRLLLELIQDSQRNCSGKDEHFGGNHKRAYENYQRTEKFVEKICFFRKNPWINVLSNRWSSIWWYP